MSHRRLTSRDYKRSTSHSFDFARWREFSIGLGAGMLIALGVYVADHRTAPNAEEVRPRPQHVSAAVQDPGDAAPEQKYDFYEMLPKFEVLVPEKEHGARVAPAARIEQPGVYVLQAGSYRQQEDAERVRAQLERQGISATVQRVAVDTDVWHRVRIGPIHDLGQLNHLREQLRAAELDALVIRVGD